MGTFRAMGTEVTVLAPCASLEIEDALTQYVAERFEGLEQTFSRFRPESVVSRLNRSRRAMAVPDEVFDVLSRAEAYTQLTDGMFDPTIGAALSASGYDKSFVPGALDRAAPATAPAPALGIRGLRLDPSARTVERARGVQLDLGGIVKGYAVDLVAQSLPACAALDAGGDAFLRGDGPDAEGWLVDVEDPRDASRTVMSLRVRDAAVATSAANRRHWRVGDRQMHHLIDPRTGAPAVTDLAQVTVVAPRAELADVLAKTTFLLGVQAGARFLGSIPEVGGVLIGAGGEVVRLGRLEVQGD